MEINTIRTIPSLGHQKPKNGNVGKSCFSQWYDAPFCIGNQFYKTAEHYMMAEKARIFGDKKNEQAILCSGNPGEAKRLGRNVIGFNDETWNKERFRIVVEANLAKFEQNEALKEFLLATGKRVLVEASPVDKIWGIGMSEDSEHLENPIKWKGLNLLGFALMEVRTRL